MSHSYPIKKDTRDVSIPLNEAKLIEFLSLVSKIVHLTLRNEG